MSKQDQSSSEQQIPRATENPAAKTAATEAERDTVTQTTGSTRPGMQHESLSGTRTYDLGEDVLPGQETRTGRTRRMMSGAVSTTEQVGSGMVGGVTHVATDLVHGVGNVGGEVVSVVRDTANTAIEGVGNIGETAVHALTGLLVGVVGGVRQIGAAAVGRGSNAMQSRPTENRVTEETPAQERQPREAMVEETIH